MDRKEYLKDYGRNNRDKSRAANRRYYRKYPDRILKIRDRFKERQRAYSQAHYKNNRDRVIASAKERMRNHPEIARKRRALKLSCEGSHSQGEWETLKIQYGLMCPSCSKKEPEIKLTEDHIIPLSKGGSDYIENIQPLCRSCNSRKHTNTTRYVIT